MQKPIGMSNEMGQRSSRLQLTTKLSRKQTLAVLVAILCRIVSIRNRSISSRELIEVIGNHFTSQNFSDLDGLRLIGLLERSGLFFVQVPISSVLWPWRSNFFTIRLTATLKNLTKSRVRHVSCYFGSFKSMKLSDESMYLWFLLT